MSFATFIRIKKWIKNVSTVFNYLFTIIPSLIILASSKNKVVLGLGEPRTLSRRGGINFRV